MARDLTGRTIIITGASSGIGAASAIECAKAGMDVVLNARRADRLGQVAGRVRDLGRRAQMVIGDVAEPGMTNRLLDTARDQMGGHYAVFANAGYGLERAVHEMDDEALRAMFEVNFFAAVDLVRAAARRLIEEGKPGHLVMCSSCLAKFSLPYNGAYAATKAAQNQVCWAMRGELRPHGIEVSSVLPITTTTEFFDVSAEKSGKAGKGGRSARDMAPSLLIQPPEKVARALVRCLRRPRAEVWTSRLVRTAAAAMTLVPAFAAFIGRQRIKQVEQPASQQPGT